MNWESERNRILKVYQQIDERKQREKPFFAFRDSAHFFRLQQRYWTMLSLFQRHGINDLSEMQILDIGCENGQLLREFIQWGAVPKNLYGIELRQAPVERARMLNPYMDIRCGSATELPWADGCMDLVCQNTVFSSILDRDMKKTIASEMVRVLKAKGTIFWYDFWLNPTNRETRGIRPAEIKELFPDCNCEFYRITLAPPITRSLVSISWGLCLFLEGLKIFNTHYLVVIRRKTLIANS